MSTLHDRAGWLADKLHNGGDYGKEAAALLVKQAAEIERLQATLKLQQASYEREIALDVASAFEEAANLAESWADYGVSVSSIGPRIAASIRAGAASQAEAPQLSRNP